jgi:hypothetical protein
LAEEQQRAVGEEKSGRQTNARRGESERKEVELSGSVD